MINFFISVETKCEKRRTGVPPTEMKIVYFAFQTIWNLFLDEIFFVSVPC